MTPIEFTVTHTFDAPPAEVWAAMVDWERHADWIPATRMQVDPGDPNEVGATFTGFTGYGPLTLEDRMRVTQIDWDEAAGKGTCEVEKLGPVLKGRAGFTVVADGEGSRLDWFEDVTIPYVPKLLAPIVNKLSAAGFSFGMKGLARSL